MEQWLFPAILTDKNDWLIKRYTSSPNLIKYIAAKEHLQEEAEILHQGTNLICGFGNRILKIYAPESCGYQASEDFNREISALQQLWGTGLRVPHILNMGCVHDQYDFYYLILEKLNILPAAQFVDTCTPKELNQFGGKLLHSLDSFKKITVDRNLAKTCSSQIFPERVKYLSKYRPRFVHADLSGDNILYDAEHLAIIDFEDWTYNAPCVEYPALIFELLHGEQTAIQTFFARPLTQTFIDEIFDGLICHYNWERLVKRYCMIDPQILTSLEEARQRFAV